MLWGSPRPHVPPEPAVGKYRQKVGVSMGRMGSPCRGRAHRPTMAAHRGVPKVPTVRGANATGTQRGPSHRGGSGRGVTQVCGAESVSVGQEGGVGSAGGRTDGRTWGQSPPRSRADGRPVPLHNDGQQWQRAQNWATNIYSGRRANTAPGQFNCGMGSVVLTLFFFFPPFFLLFFLFFSSVLLPGQVKSLFPPPLKKAFSTPARCSWGAGTGTDPMGKLRHEGGRQR